MIVGKGFQGVSYVILRYFSDAFFRKTHLVQRHHFILNNHLHAAVQFS
jgi:hypothetical protein